MAECSGCGGQADHEWCDVCKIMLPVIMGHSHIRIQNGPEVDSLREALGNPEPKPVQIWTRMAKSSSAGMLDPYATEWARSGVLEVDESQWICSPPPPWAPSDAEIAVFDSRGRDCDDEAVVRRASRGGLLPDGSYLSWSGKGFFLDGMPIRLPYRGLARMLRTRSRHQGVNWKLLLRAVDLALTKVSGSARNPTPVHRGANPISHPTYLLLTSRDEPFFELMHRAAHSRMLTAPPSFYRDTEWMRRWEEEVADDIESDEFAELSHRVPVSLICRKGRLQLRVRRPTGWRRISLGHDPEVWARIVTWALSPPTHRDFRALLALQQHLFSDSDLLLIEERDRRGVEFLRQIVDDSEKVRAMPEVGGFHVAGTSGLEYTVSPGRGPHGSRFLVTPMQHRDPNEVPPRWRHHLRQMNRQICIVETPEMMRMVLGDAIGAIIMTLIDDMSSRSRIDSLAIHIRHQARVGRTGEGVLDPEEERLRRDDMEARHLGNVMRNNVAAERVRRCSESFPRLWSVLLRLPLGERLTFTAMRGGGVPNIRFDGCGTTFATESMDDRRAVYRMLEAAGWVRDTVEEGIRGVQRMYIRTGTGRRDLGEDVRELCQFLEQRLLIRNNRIRLLPEPLWHHFERRNPGTADLLPGTAGLIR